MQEQYYKATPLMDDCFKYEDYYFTDKVFDRSEGIELSPEDVEKIHESLKESYQKDLNQKNIVIKQVNQLVNEKKKDPKNLQRLANNIILLRNVFTKESILEFFNSKFTDKTLGQVGDVIYEIVVISREGKVKDHQHYADEVFKIMAVKGVTTDIEKLWKKHKQSVK